MQRLTLARQEKIDHQMLEGDRDPIDAALVLSKARGGLPACLTARGASAGSPAISGAEVLGWAGHQLPGRVAKQQLCEMMRTLHEGKLVA